jgi:hypothetical protein
VPKFAEFEGIVVGLYFRDHPPAHFHARYQDHKAVIEIEALCVYSGSLPPAQLRKVLGWAAENQAALRARWAELQR